MSSYRPSIVTFPLSVRDSEISPILCSSTPLFPTPPLVYPKFPRVPLGAGERPLGYEEQRCWANCQLVSKIANLCRPDPPTLQTDGDTDGQTTCDRKTKTVLYSKAFVTYVRPILEYTVQQLGLVS